LNTTIDIININTTTSTNLTTLNIFSLLHIDRLPTLRGDYLRDLAQAYVYVVVIIVIVVVISTIEIVNFATL